MNDRDFERVVEERLAARVRPASPRVLDTLPQRIMTVQQVAPASTLGGWLNRAVLAIGAIAILVAAVLAGPAAMDRLAGLFGGPGEPVASQGQTMSWSGVLQFRGAPDEANPAPDGYGHSAVFSYLGNRGLAHDPAGYILLHDFVSGEADRWYDASLPGLYVGFDPGSGRLELQPAGGGADGHAAILAWRSPVDASIVVSGSVEADATCGDGIQFSIDKGTATLERFSVASDIERFSEEIEVRSGDALYFMVEPGSTDACDTTWLTVDIATR